MRATTLTALAIGLAGLLAINAAPALADNPCGSGSEISGPSVVNCIWTSNTTWTVPNGAVNVTAAAYGQPGQDGQAGQYGGISYVCSSNPGSSGGTGGEAADVTGPISVSPGTTLTISVASGRSGGTGGHPSDFGRSCVTGSGGDTIGGNGGNGGGASFVTDPHGNLLIVAAGGGGGGGGGSNPNGLSPGGDGGSAGSDGSSTGFGNPPTSIDATGGSTGQGADGNGLAGANATGSGGQGGGGGGGGGVLGGGGGAGGDNNGGAGGAGGTNLVPAAGSSSLAPTSVTPQVQISYEVASAPSVQITSPANGQTYNLNQSASTSFSCSEGTSGPGLSLCNDSGGTYVTAAGPRPTLNGSGPLDTSRAGTFTYTVTATSSDGLTGSATITYYVAAAPTAQISSPATGRTYAVGQSVPTSFSCSEGENGPGISSCTDPTGSGSPGQLNTSEPGSYTYTVTATSGDGQTGTASISYTVAAAPSAQVSSPPTGLTLPEGTSIPTVFSCADGAYGPGVSSCVDQNGIAIPLPGPSVYEGFLEAPSTPGSYTYTVSASSYDGQSGTGSINYTVAAPPSATIGSPGNGQTYKLGQSVPTSFSCSDGAYGPGIGSCTDSNGSGSPGQLDTSKGGTFTYTVTATSDDGQTASSQITYTVAAPPSVTISQPASGQLVARGSRVATTFSCTPGAGGPPIQSCQDSTGSSSGSGLLSTSSVGTFTYSVTAVAQDGQSTTQSISYSVANGPSVTITQPAGGGTYEPGQSVPTAFSCAEGKSAPGLSSCSDSNGANGSGSALSQSGTGSLYTASAGPLFYTVTAVSQDGLTTSKTIAYRVAWVPTKTQVACVPAAVTNSNAASCTITVTNTGDSTYGPPTGSVSLSTAPANSLSQSSCVLSGSGVSSTCRVSFTPYVPGQQGVTASYPAAATFGASTGHASVQVRDVTAAEVQCSPSTLTVGATSTCTVRVLDGQSYHYGLGIAPTGSATFAVPAADSVRPTSCQLQSLAADGFPYVASCAVTFTAGKAGSPIVTAKYAQSATELATSASQTVTVTPAGSAGAVAGASRSATPAARTAALHSAVRRLLAEVRRHAPPHRLAKARARGSRRGGAERPPRRAGGHHRTT